MRHALLSLLTALSLGTALTLGLGTTSLGQTADLVVEVRDDSTGAPVVDATVVVVGTGLGAITGDDGIARIEVPPGAYPIQVRKLGYDPVSFVLSFEADELYQGTVSLIPAVAMLGEVAVEASRFNDILTTQGFARRQAERQGTFITRDQMVRQGKANLGEVLRGLPGVRLIRWDDALRAVSSRSGIGPNGLRSAEPCPFSFVIDGIHVGSDVESAATWSTGDIAGVEVYAGPSLVPIEYAVSSPCGVIVVWTRISLE